MALGLVWLLDAALQFQPFMFTRDFVTQIIEPSASGNPSVISHPLTWAAHVMLHHLVLYNAIFALIQLALAVGILWKPTVKVALAASIGWSLAVWWFGEGLGGILLSPPSDPFMGAPGGVILYAFVAVLVWPVKDRAQSGSTDSVATCSPLGPMVPRSFWLAMWASFTYLTLQPANRSPHSLGSMVSGMADGEPAWIKTIDSSLGQAVNGNGTEISVVFAALFLVVGLGVFVPRLVRPVVAVAAVLGLVIWVVEDFGEIFTSQGTDPSSGLLLALLAAVFWPTAAVRTVPGAAQLRPDPVAV